MIPERPSTIPAEEAIEPITVYRLDIILYLMGLNNDYLDIVVLLGNWI